MPGCNHCVANVRPGAAAAITTPSDTTTDTTTPSPTPAETGTGEASPTAAPIISTDSTIEGIKDFLTYPTEIINDGSTMTLKIDQHFYEGPFSSFYTRAFGPGGGATSIPGPTWRIKAGDTVKMRLENALGPQGSYAGIHNELKEPNTTNLHTHGLHITGDPGGDDVFTVVEPGGSFEYTYELPSFHMPGTHWYHPHHHGSTSVQAGGGAAGMIIVEDTDDLGLPSVVTEAEEMPLFLQYMDINAVASLEQAAQGDLWQVTETVDTSEVLSLYILINGLFWPKVQMDMNKWYRWRVVYAAVETGMESITLDPTCEMQLIAKDGVYLHNAPRAISSIVLGPGNRADIMSLNPPNVGPGLCFKAAAAAAAAVVEVTGGGMAGYTGEIMSLVVIDHGDTSESIPQFSVARPCYLVDITGNDVSASSHTLEFGRPPVLTFDGNSQEDGFVNEDTSIGSIESGMVQEFRVVGADAHPFHQHVHPYQITSLSAETDWFKVGDWHDTLLLLGGAGQDVTVRFQTDTFITKTVIHCHILEHEDNGMMAFLETSNSGATTWTGALGIDASCKNAGNPYSTATGVAFLKGLAAGTDVVTIASASKECIVTTGMSGEIEYKVDLTESSGEYGRRFDVASCNTDAHIQVVDMETCTISTISTYSSSTGRLNEVDYADDYEGDNEELSVSPAPSPPPPVTTTEADSGASTLAIAMGALFSFVAMVSFC
eukprot:gene12748-15074_t